MANRLDAKSSEKYLRYTAGALEEIRELLGVPLTITSGYRNNALNKAVGGSPTSKHKVGLCADFKPNGISVYDAMTKIIKNKDSLHSVRKVIVEGVSGKEWIHVQAKVDSSEQLELYATNDGKNYIKVA